jgi:flagellar assembly protein FliH
MSSSAEFAGVFAVPITSLQYRDIAGRPISSGPSDTDARSSEAAGKRRAEVELSEAEFAERIRWERGEAAREAEQKLRPELELKLQAARAPIVAAVAAFEGQRDEYFSRVEAEVVQLALAIAGKILHREAQVDPMLVAALVRMAIEKIQDGSSVTIRVSPGRAAQWKQYFAAQANAARVEILGDTGLSEHDCMLETELGSANFGLDAQLKEVEQGFFDLLALRPSSR